LTYKVEPVEARLVVLRSTLAPLANEKGVTAAIAAALVAPVARSRRLAAVATPVLSMVVSLARSTTIPEAFVAPVARRLAAVATPVLSIVEMRVLRTFPVVTLLVYKVPPVDARLAAVATPVVSIVEMRTPSELPVDTRFALKVLPVEAKFATVAPAVVCAVPSLNAIPLEPSFIPVARSN
jgi:hypothetical protein